MSGTLLIDQVGGWAPSLFFDNGPPAAGGSGDMGGLQRQEEEAVRAKSEVEIQTCKAISLEVCSKAGTSI